MIKLDSTPTITNLEEEWKRAKEAERQWNTYRRQVEEQILKTVVEETWLDILPDKGSIETTGMKISFSQSRKFDQTLLSETITTNPFLLQSLFRIEYKPNSNPNLDKFVASGDSNGVGRLLLECFEDKAGKPSFSKK